MPEESAVPDADDSAPDGSHCSKQSACELTDLKRAHRTEWRTRDIPHHSGLDIALGRASAHRSPFNSKTSSPSKLRAEPGSRSCSGSPMNFERSQSSVLEALSPNTRHQQALWTETRREPLPNVKALTRPPAHVPGSPTTRLQRLSPIVAPSAKQTPTASTIATPKTGGGLPHSSSAPSDLRLPAPMMGTHQVHSHCGLLFFLGGQMGSDGLGGKVADSLRARDALGGEDAERRREGIYNFFQVPRNLEPLLLFGFLACVDSFIDQFTFLPLRVFFAAAHRLDRRTRVLTPAQVDRLGLPAGRRWRVANRPHSHVATMLSASCPLAGAKHPLQHAEPGEGVDLVGGIEACAKPPHLTRSPSSALLPVYAEPRRSARSAHHARLGIFTDGTWHQDVASLPQCPQSERDEIVRRVLRARDLRQVVHLFWAGYPGIPLRFRHLGPLWLWLCHVARLACRLLLPHRPHPRSLLPSRRPLRRHQLQFKRPAHPAHQQQLHRAQNVRAPVMSPVAVKTRARRLL
eukprot:scaffold15296_cov101-Isochrysis_galbana.AAC.3